MSETRKRTDKGKDTKKQELPSGTDLSLLQVETGVKTVRFDYGEYSWEFQYREVTWAQQWDAIETSWESVEREDKTFEPEFNVPAYYQKLLMQALVEVPGGGEPTLEFLISLGPVVFSKLSTIVPSPILNLEVERVKKELPEESTDGSQTPPTGGL